jgi:hypothetical protein
VGCLFCNTGDRIQGTLLLEPYPPSPFFCGGGGWKLGFELRANKAGACKGGTLLEPHLQFIFALIVLEMRSRELFVQAGLEPQSS